MAISRIASTDVGYTTGLLSLYPEAKDSRFQLYEASNNCFTKLKQSLTYVGKYIVVDDTSLFPSSGILRIGPPPGEPGTAELVYYETKSTGLFKNLIRGFAGSRQNPWPIGSSVSNAVFAEHHNATKDAIINIETNLGTNELPSSTSLNGILKQVENRFLSPKPLFRAFPFAGPPPLKVRFQNFSTGPLVRYLWDFGDGTTSVEKSPTHIFQKEGVYSVQLNIISVLGAQGIVTKNNYITVSEEAQEPFFYATPLTGYSSQTNPLNPTTFNFIDQTDGDIVQRYWNFDGPGKINGVPMPTQGYAEYDPNIHTITYTYDVPGSYEPSVLILFENQTLKRAFLKERITVL